MAALNDTHEFTPPGPWCHECGNYVTEGRHNHRRKLHQQLRRDLAAIKGATEAQRAAFEADFNKFQAAERERQEIAMARVLTDGNGYLPSREHFPGCLCETCEKVRADNPPYVVRSGGYVNQISEDGLGKWIIGVDPAYPTATPEQCADVRRQLDEALGFAPMSPKPAAESPAPSPIPARALRYGVAEAPLLEWPE